MKICLALLVAFTIVKSVLTAGGHTRGKHFVVSFLYNHGQQETKHSSNYIFITSEEEGYAIVEMYADSSTPGWKHNATLTPGGSVTVTMPSDSELKNLMSIEKKGIKITSTVDVRVYAMNDDVNRMSADAAMVLPVEALSTEYVVPSADINPVFAVVAVLHNTHVNVSLKSTCSVSYGGRVYNGGDHIVVTLQEFDVFQIHSKFSVGDRCDFTGTDVVSDKAVAVFAGSTCYATTTQACEHLMEQLIPSELLGMRFIIPDLADNNNFKVRLVVAHDDTHIFINEHHRDLTIHSYQAEMDKTESLNLDVPDGTILELFTNKGASVTQFDQSSAPFVIPIPSVDNYGWNYTFSTMDNPTTQTFLSYINIVAHRTSADSMTIDGQRIDHSLWRRVIDLGYSVATIFIPAGTHTVVADSSFMVQVYGYNGAASYGFQAGYYLPKLPSENIFVTTPTPTMGHGSPHPTHPSEKCEDGKTVNCAALNSALGICAMPDSASHYCRKFCGHCTANVVG